MESSLIFSSTTTINLYYKYLLAILIYLSIQAYTWIGSYHIPASLIRPVWRQLWGRPHQTSRRR